MEILIISADIYMIEIVSALYNNNIYVKVLTDWWANNKFLPIGELCILE